MKHNNRSNVGMELLVQRYKKKFEIEENINYYSYEDFIQAERKYLKFVLEGSAGAGEFQPE